MSHPEFEGNVDDLLALATRAALAAADVHASAARSGLEVAQKSSPTDLVTEVDRRAEVALVEAIRSERPGDGVVGEEGADHPSETGLSWILDPLDGTTNFVYGYPAHAVSVGLEIEGQRALGVVCDTARQQLYAGSLWHPATREGQPISVAQQRDPSLALLGTGFLPDASVRGRQGELLARLTHRFRDVRRSGSAAIDLCHIATGALDVYYEFGLGHWDIAGGAAIAEAAGATVLELAPRSLPAPLVIAGNGAIVEQLASMLIEAGAVAES
jgi:myo-inositol-1(or 4)-monophosphatase